MKTPITFDQSELIQTAHRQEVDAVLSQTLIEALCDQLEALIAFAEEVRDCDPERIRSHYTDPQDAMPDMIEEGYLIDLQYEAEKLIGKKPKAEQFDAARRLAMFGSAA